MGEPDAPHGGGRNRRSFINWLLGSSFGALCVAVLYPVARFLSPPEVPEASRVTTGLFSQMSDPHFIWRESSSSYPTRTVAFGLSMVKRTR